VGHWARKLSWKETAEEFRTSWDKVHDAVAYLVVWGLEHRVLGPIRAIGVDETLVRHHSFHAYFTHRLHGSHRIRLGRLPRHFRHSAPGFGQRRHHAGGATTAPVSRSTACSAL
jgi:hypothetical protein